MPAEKLRCSVCVQGPEAVYSQLPGLLLPDDSILCFDAQVYKCRDCGCRYIRTEGVFETGLLEPYKPKSAGGGGNRLC